jgi:uncharacterized protein involved in exopolysaccharide biosynthesis
MLTKRAVTRLIATAMAAGAIVAGIAAATPTPHYSTTVQTVTGSASVSPNTYHDI